MKIKNTHELRLRANSHARNDHIEQGTYGDGSINGKPNFVGCAVGCLSTPHRQRDLFNFIKSKIDASGSWWMSQDEAHAGLRDEFGITGRLAFVAEACFEGQGAHGAAINFVRDFAYACPEGADIRDTHVEAFLRWRGVGRRRCKSRRCKTNSYQLLINYLTGPPIRAAGVHKFSSDAQPIRDEVMGEFATAFLDWLRSRGVSA